MVSATSKAYYEEFCHSVQVALDADRSIIELYGDEIEQPIKHSDNYGRVTVSYYILVKSILTVYWFATNSYMQLGFRVLLCGVVAPCGGVDNKVPQLHSTLVFSTKNTNCGLQT